MKCFIAGLCKISLSKRLLSLLFPLNAKVWNCYSSCLMENFKTMRIFTPDRSPSAESFYPFSAVYFPMHSCWKVKPYKKCTGNRKVVFIIHFSPAIVIMLNSYGGGIGYVSDGGSGYMGKKDRGETKNIVYYIYWNQTAEKEVWYPRTDTDESYQIKCDLWMEDKKKYWICIITCSHVSEKQDILLEIYVSGGPSPQHLG